MNGRCSSGCPDAAAGDLSLGQSQLCRPHLHDPDFDYPVYRGQLESGKNRRRIVRRHRRSHQRACLTSAIRTGPLPTQTRLFSRRSPASVIPFADTGSITLHDVNFLAGGGLATAAARFGTAQMVHLPPMKPAPPLIDPERMMAFVDPLPMPEVAKPIGKRLSASRKTQVPFYRIPIQRVLLEDPPGRPAHPLLGLRKQRARTHHRSAQRRGNPRRMAEPAARRSIFSPSITHLWARKKAFPNRAQWCMFTAPESRPRAMAGPRPGMRPASRPLTTIRTSRTPRCSGITTMPWESTG